MRHLTFALTLALALVMMLALTSKGESDEPPALTIIQNRGEQVVRGAHIYDLNCAVCHGDTAKGYAEARSVFPESHQRCERCHRPGNPAIEENMVMEMRNVFSVGEPPALHGEDALAAFPNAQVLYSYIQATMPRYEPGRLTRAEYLDLTAFLLDINGLLPEGVTVNEQSAASIELN